MALILVGDFDSEKVLRTIKSSFGDMKSDKVDYIRPTGIHDFVPQEIFTSTLVPLIGNDAEVYIRYRVPGRMSKESLDRKSTRLNSSHTDISRMPSSAWKKKKKKKEEKKKKKQKDKKKKKK